jgi:hypothetical protein
VCYAKVVSARNVTLSLPDDLIRKAKVHAAQRNSTVNALVRREEMHERR